MPKTGRTLQDLAAEIERQNDAKRDFVADTRLVRMVERFTEPEDRSLALQFATNGEPERFGIKGTAHGQIAQRLGIPKKHYDRLAESHPDLLCNEVTTLFEREPQKRMLRTLDGDVRAFLSDRYRPLDNRELCEAIFPVLADIDAEVMSAEVTDTKLYIKFTVAKLEAKVVGDTIRAGGIITNSEVGLGTLMLADWDLTLACLNGMTREKLVRQTHVGRATGIGGIDASEFFKSDTREADDRALFLKLRDTTTAMFTAERFEARMRSLQSAAELPIENPIETVEVVAKRFALPNRTHAPVLQHLLSGGNLNAYSLANAVTRHSQDVESYDEASDMEAVGGKIVELTPSQWSRVQREADHLANNKARA